MDITINLTGIDHVVQKIKELQTKGHNTQPLMEELANHLYNVTSSSFQNEASPDGKSWSPIEFRKEDRNPNKILYDEGTMQDTLQAISDKDSATVGLNAISNGYPYPVVHQFGSEDGTIEARPFMPIDKDGKIYEDTAKELEEIVEDYINEVLK